MIGRTVQGMVGLIAVEGQVLHSGQSRVAYSGSSSMAMVILNSPSFPESRRFGCHTVFLRIKTDLADVYQCRREIPEKSQS